jgi:hypothetical protein
MRRYVFAIHRALVAVVRRPARWSACPTGVQPARPCRAPNGVCSFVTASITFDINWDDGTIHIQRIQISLPRPMRSGAGPVRNREREHGLRRRRAGHWWACRRGWIRTELSPARNGFPPANTPRVSRSTSTGTTAS